MKKVAIIKIISGLLAFLFMYAAISKLLEYKTFMLQIGHSPVINKLSNIAWMLPVAEIVTALLLTFEFTRKTGLYISIILLLAFTAYIAGMLGFAKHLPCSCGGVIKQLSWKQHVWLNVLFLLLAITGIAVERKQNLSSIRSG
jgi:hypothetical protein